MIDNKIIRYTNFSLSAITVSAICAAPPSSMSNECMRSLVYVDICDIIVSLLY